jgi:glycosyltransferase involved in cell wall biosynthesis
VNTLLKWPFEAVLNGARQETSWVALHGPIISSAQQDQFARLRYAGRRFVGVTSYFDFPCGEEPGPLDYESICEAWCHCFQTPALHFERAPPLALISTSDFADWLWIERNAAQGTAVSAPAHDYVYVGATDPRRKQAKNWALGAQCIPRLYRNLGLRALVIGTPDALLGEQPGIRFVASLDWPTLLAAMMAAKFVFLPNRADPSPRVLTEALCLDVPIVVHRGILGGWKYVNRFTGRLFEGPDDVVETATRCLQLAARPRDWFRAHYGPFHAGRRLAHLLRPLDDRLAGESLLIMSATGPARLASA